MGILGLRSIFFFKKNLNFDLIFFKGYNIFEICGFYGVEKILISKADNGLVYFLNKLSNNFKIYFLFVFSIISFFKSIFIFIIFGVCIS